MIDFLIAFAVGFPCMWLYGRLTDKIKIAELKSRRRSLMKQALTHQGTFAELLTLQKHILTLSAGELRIVALPALISCAPLILALSMFPAFATPASFAGLLIAYLATKWFFNI